MSKTATKPAEIVSTLNGLIETCRDGQKGFAEAAEHVQNLELKNYCLDQSRLRAKFAEELRGEVYRLGGDPEQTGSMAGAAHRAWMNLKSALGGGDHAIMAACESGEDSAVSEYEQALAKRLPSNIHTLVEQQYRSIKQSHDRVKLVRDHLS
jgi:uncharacterized protein (TIGR02284 family)